MSPVNRLTKQVLIVDDDAPTRDGLAMMLEAAGHDVHHAENGQQALRLLRQRQVDIILLDLVMPVMDGWTFRMHQLEDDRLRAIPVVVLSGEADVLREARLLGVNRSFPKALDGESTLALMGELFDAVEEVA
jgi:CheY-like chemotaxis protein